MGKRIFVFAVALVVLLSSCSTVISPSSYPQGPEFSAVNAPSAGAEIAMLLQGEQKETSRSQAIWAVLSRFAGENGTTSGQYLTDGGSEQAAQAALELAIKGGGKLILVLGEEITPLLAQAPGNYPDVQFIFVDGRSHFALEENSTAIEFVWAEAGWLAGYAAVYERLAGLGYWQMENQQAMEYAAGFALGAEAAAGELEMVAGAVRLWGIVPGPAQQPATWQENAAAKFKEGMQLLLVNSQPALEASQGAARQNGGQIIPFEMQPAASSTGFLTVVLDCRPMLQQVLERWKAGNFPGEKTFLADVANGGISLERGEELEFFTPKNYEIAQAAFKGGTLSSQLMETIYPLERSSIPNLPSLPLVNVQLYTEEESVASLPSSGLPSSVPVPPQTP